MTVVKKIETGIALWCPACSDYHHLSDLWTWDKNEEFPTINPSIKVMGKQWEKESPFYKPAFIDVPYAGITVCHSYVKNGKWEYLPDSNHTLSGQTVSVVPIPEDDDDD